MTKLTYLFTSKNPLIQRLGGYNVSYTKDQKFAILALIFSLLLRTNGNNSNDNQEEMTLELISEYFGYHDLLSNSAFLKFVKKNFDEPDHVINIVQQLNYDQKEFFITILLLIAGYGGFRDLKMANAIQLALSIGISENEFQKKVKNITLVLKK